MNSRASRLGRQAALISILAFVYFLAAAIVTHFVSPQYDFVRDYISDYAIGPLGWIFGSAFWAICIGCIALAVALTQAVSPQALSRTGVALLVIVGLCDAVAFLYPTDIPPPGAPPVTTSGAIHLAAALVSWILFLVGAIMISSRLKRDADFGRWRPLLLGLAWLSALLFVALAAIIASKAPYGGLAEKIFILPRTLWALILGTLAFRASGAGER